MPRSAENADLIEAIYDAAIDAGQWPRVLERLAQTFGGSSAHLSVENVAMTEGRILSFGTDPAYAQSYAEYYASRNVLWQRMVQLSLSEEVITSRMIMPKDELRQSEFYNDFLRPQDGEETLVCAALRQADAATHLLVWRSERQGPWEREQMEALATLTPHLRRALRVNQAVGEMRLARDLVGEALDRLEHGVMIVSAQSGVLFANRAAEAVLADTGGLRLERRRLAARRAADTSALRRVIAAAAQNGMGGSLAIAREARPPLIVLIVPANAGARGLIHHQPSAILLIKDPERPAKPSLTAFIQYFDLTPAQAALAHEMIRGDGVAAAAARLGVSYATARTHLLQIFQKTETRRQAELVRLMLQWNEGPVATGQS